MKKFLCLALVFSFFSFNYIYSQETESVPAETEEIENQEKNLASDESIKILQEQNPNIPVDDLMYFGENSFVTIDFDYLGTGILNNGFGLGINCETQFTKFLCIKGGISNITLFPSELNPYITLTIGLKIDLLLYPCNQGLKWLYLGAGIGTDHIRYYKWNGGEESSDTIISCAPTIGWKQPIMKMMLIDAFVDYRFVITENNIPEALQKYGNSRFEFGFSLQLDLGETIRFFIKPKKSTTPKEETEA